MTKESVTAKEETIVSLIGSYREDFAKSEATAFADWVADNSWQQYDGSGSWIGEGRKVKTTEQLFNLYLKTKS